MKNWYRFEISVDAIESADEKYLKELGDFLRRALIGMLENSTLEQVDTYSQVDFKLEPCSTVKKFPEEYEKSEKDCMWERE